MTTTPAITVHLGPGPFDGQVLVGDKDISQHVMAVTAKASGGRPVEVWLQLRDVVLKADTSQARLGMETAAILTDLGWTPPDNPAPAGPVVTEPGCQHEECVLDHPHAGPAVLSPAHPEQGGEHQ